MAYACVCGDQGLNELCCARKWVEKKQEELSVDVKEGEGEQEDKEGKEECDVRERLLRCARASSSSEFAGEAVGIIAHGKSSEEFRSLVVTSDAVRELLPRVAGILNREAFAGDAIVLELAVILASLLASPLEKTPKSLDTGEGWQEHLPMHGVAVLDDGIDDVIGALFRLLDANSGFSDASRDNVRQRECAQEDEGTGKEGHHHCRSIPEAATAALLQLVDSMEGRRRVTSHGGRPEDSFYHLFQALRPVLRAEAGEVSADAVAILHRVTWMRLPQLNERMHSLQEFMRSGDAEEMLQLLLGHLPSKEADARQTEMPSGCPGALHVFRALTEDMGLLEHPEAERLDLLQGDNIESLLLRLVKVLEIDFLSRDADGSHGSGYCAQIGDDAARDTEGSGAALDEREERSCNGAIGAAMGIMNALLRHQHFHQVVCEGELLSDIVSYVAQATQLRCSCAWSSVPLAMGLPPERIVQTGRVEAFVGSLKSVLGDEWPFSTQGEGRNDKDRFSRLPGRSMALAALSALWQHCRECRDSTTLDESLQGQLQEAVTSDATALLEDIVECLQQRFDVVISAVESLENLLHHPCGQRLLLPVAERCTSALVRAVVASPESANDMNADSDEHFSNAEIESRNAMAIHVLYCNAKEIEVPPGAGVESLWELVHKEGILLQRRLVRNVQRGISEEETIASRELMRNSLVLLAELADPANAGSNNEAAEMWAKELVELEDPSLIDVCLDIMGDGLCEGQSNVQEDTPQVAAGVLFGLVSWDSCLQRVLAKGKGDALLSRPAALLLQVRHDCGAAIEPLGIIARLATSEEGFSLVVDKLPSLPTYIEPFLHPDHEQAAGFAARAVSGLARTERGARLLLEHPRAGSIFSGVLSLLEATCELGSPKAQAMSDGVLAVASLFACRRWRWVILGLSSDHDLGVSPERAVAAVGNLAALRSRMPEVGYNALYTFNSMLGDAMQVWARAPRPADSAARWAALAVFDKCFGPDWLPSLAAECLSQPQGGFNASLADGVLDCRLNAALLVANLAGEPAMRERFLEQWGGEIAEKLTAMLTDGPDSSTCSLAAYSLAELAPPLGVEDCEPGSARRPDNRQGKGSAEDLDEPDGERRKSVAGAWDDAFAIGGRPSQALQRMSFEAKRTLALACLRWSNGPIGDAFPVPWVLSTPVVAQRDNPMEGACQQCEVPNQGLRRALYGGVSVRFEGGPAEQGTGAAVRREWFSLLASDARESRRCLLVSRDGGVTFHPHPASETGADDHLAYFETLGRLLGLALYHGEPFPLRLTPSACSRLLFMPVEPRSELRWVDPELATNLTEKLPAMADSEVADLGLTFTDVRDDTGQVFPPGDRVALCAGGEGLGVEGGAKMEEFCDLVARHRVYGAVHEQVEALRKGFAAVVPLRTMVQLSGALSSPCELATMLAGETDVDVGDWRANAAYQDGLNETTHVVKCFWEAVGRMDAKERSQLLAFATGLPQPPAGGMANLTGFMGASTPFTIGRLPHDRDYPGALPMANSCVNVIRLPSIPETMSISDGGETLLSRLLTASEHGHRGFDNF